MYKFSFLILTSYTISVFAYLEIFPTITTKTSSLSDTHQELTKTEVSTQKDYIQLMVDNYKEIAITTNRNSKKYVSFGNVNDLIKLPEITQKLNKPHVGARSVDELQEISTCVTKELNINKLSNHSRNNNYNSNNPNRNGMVTVFPVKFVKITAKRLCRKCDNEQNVDSTTSTDSERDYEVSMKNEKKYPIIEVNFTIPEDNMATNEVFTNNEKDNSKEEYEGITDPMSMVTKETSYNLFTLIEKSEYSNNISDPSEDWDKDSSFDSDLMNFNTFNNTQQREGNDKNNETFVSIKSEATPASSCVFCNNIDNENCEAPLNKLIPSIQCKNEGEICYSLHTPFGLVDRGCINPYSSLATYVCVQQLCNTITISELPFVFSKKEEWIRDVKEISNFMHSVRENPVQMLICLKCEANITKSETTQDEIKCLTGSLDHLQPQLCKEDEVCAVKVIRKHNYIWRGCLKFPLYNYWWEFCNSDHCNFEKLVTI